MNYTDSLVRALQRTCELLEQSEEVAWSPLTPEKVREKLLKVLKRVSAGRRFSKTSLAVEFAPTGTLQEIAMANGWHEEYMSLADVVDRHST